MDLMPLGNVLFARMYRKTVTGKYLILGGGKTTIFLAGKLVAFISTALMSLTRKKG